MGNSIIDLIIRIKNGYMARKQEIEVIYSNFNEEVLKKLKSLGFIKNYSLIKGTGKINVELHYKNNEPAITDIHIYSKPGKRHYTSYKELKPILGGLGCSLLSTPKGVMTNKEARRAKIGGELLFSIW